MNILKERREELNLTLEDVARKVGVSKGTVGKWETGYIRNMGRDKVAKLADALQLDPVEIIRQARIEQQNEPVPNPESGLTPDGVRLAEKIDRLSEESRRELEKYVDYLVSQAHQDT